MKLRLKKDGTICASNRFNMCGLSEIIVYFPEDMTTDFIVNYDVWLPQKNEWKDLSQAFKDRDVITDNYNTMFFEPPTSIDKQRGYTL